MEGGIVNISGFTNIQPYLPLVRSSSGRGADETGEVSTPVWVFNMATKRTEEEPFYEYQEKPWLSDPGFEQCEDKKAAPA